MLPSQHRLRNSAAIRRVRQVGRRWRHPLFTLFVQPNGEETSRFAIAVSRRLGNAVARNRYKRRMREALRPYLPALRGGYNCLFVARRELAAASFADIEAAICQLLRRAGLLPHAL